MFARFNRKTAAVLSGVTASLLIATAADAAGEDKPVVVYAEQLEDARTERVSYADLNLAQRSDERKLVRRVTGAIRRVCQIEHSQAGLQDSDYYVCADGAWDGARPQIAQAVTRAKEIAVTGQSSIAAAAITISVTAL